MSVTFGPDGTRDVRELCRCCGRRSVYPESERDWCEWCIRTFVQPIIPAVDPHAYERGTIIHMRRPNSNRL